MVSGSSIRLFEYYADAIHSDKGGSVPPQQSSQKPQSPQSMIIPNDLVPTHEAEVRLKCSLSLGTLNTPNNTADNMQTPNQFSRQHSYRFAG